MSSSARATAALFDPQRLQLAREAAGLRKVQLAERIGLSAAAISQFEHGTNRPSPATLGKLALTLGVSVDFFEQRPGPPAVAAPQGAFFRSLRSTPQLERVRASARALLVCELARTLEAYVQLPAVRLPSVPLGEDDEPLQADDAAAAARGQLGVAPVARGAHCQLRAQDASQDDRARGRRQSASGQRRLGPIRAQRAAARRTTAKTR